MLNLWKKIQEKGHINSSPKRKETVISTLDPRYDGPLRGFEPSANDIIPLEKCHLNLDFDDICDNKLGYNYFKNFLETKMAVDVLDLWSSFTENDEKCGNEEIFSKSKSDNELCSNSNVAKKNYAPLSGSDNIERSSNSSFVNEKLFKLPDDVRTKITSLVNKSTDNLTEADGNILKPVLSEMLLEYWNEFTRTEWYCRYQVDLLTSRSVTLGDVISHDTTISYFIQVPNIFLAVRVLLQMFQTSSYPQFLEIEGCQHTFEFWFAATYFEKFVHNSIKSGTYNADKNHALSEAINIYEKYLSLQATCPLGFGDEIRCAVEEAICDEENGPRPDCFKPAIDVVLAFLRRHYLIPFFSSQHYVHLLSDMIRNSTSVKNHSPASSVSEYSTESRQPLLNKLDPDSIWRRRKESGLSFGRIDQFGRFRRDIEPDPGRTTESKISKMMKKWVQRNENRVEEEMAWQVAEMVVKDIIDMTMGCNTDHDGTEEDCFVSENSK